jgi:hypothetical protein
MSTSDPSRAGRFRLARFFVSRSGAAALVVGGAIALTACGGGSNAPTTSTTSTNAGAGAATTTSGGGARTNAAFVKYTACLKEHGVTLPDFGAGGDPGQGGPPPSTTGDSGTTPQAPSGVDNATFQKAQTACASLRPKGTRNGGPGFGGGQNSAAFAAYRNCLTIHGVKESELRPGAGTTPSAKVRKAMTECASLRPARGAPPASTTTTPSQ